MSPITMGIGTALSMLGVGAFFGSTRKHITALIPAFLGLPLVILGVAAQKEDLAEGAAVGATGVSVVGLLVSLQGLFLPQLVPLTDVPRSEYPMRGAVQTITAVLCGIHVSLSVRALKGAVQQD